MRFFSQLLLGATALVGLCAAENTTNNLGFTFVPTTVEAGKAVTLLYTAEFPSIPAIITLRKGPIANLTVIQTLTSSAMNGTFVWVPGYAYQEANDYSLEIQQGDQINNSGELAITGSNAASVSSAMAATASLASVGSAISASYASSQSVASIESIIASYNSSLAALTAAPTTTGTESMGTGTVMPRNTTFSVATLTNAATVTSSTTLGGSSTGSAPAATSSQAAAARAVSVISGASPLALVLCVVAVILF